MSRTDTSINHTHRRMKTVMPIVFIALSSYFSYGQKLVTSVHAEYTVIGPQYGSALVYESKKQFGLGIFYQAGLKPSEASASDDRFYGLHLQVPLVKCQQMSFSGLLRSGLVRDRFVVIVPGVETSINLGKRLALGFGMSLRMNKPAVSSRLSFKLQ